MENYVHGNRFSILVLCQNAYRHRFSNGVFYLVGPVEFPRCIHELEGADADKMLFVEICCCG